MTMQHGGDLSEAIARYGGPPGAWLDLSTGINPVPWPVPTGLLQARLHRLPSRDDEIALIEAARAAYRVPHGAEIAIAPGTQALIQWLPRLAADGAVAIVGPTYSEHGLAWSYGGRDVASCDDIDKAPPWVRHAVLVNPNNPDGREVPMDAIARAAGIMQQRSGWLVIDEAFADVAPDLSATALCVDLPIVILRSFGKFYGLPGLRLGFAIAAPTIIRSIRNALGPWAVSSSALSVGAAALRDEPWAIATRAALQRKAAGLDAVLQSAGCDIVGGTPLFRLVRHGGAGGLHEALARQQIWCRKFDWADDLLRFGLPTEDEVDRLRKALA
ncbi:threonine-phosphate decarboxylase CobD [Bradyrhizobium sp. LHD-71]|uniref:threonine-phosphate decarboxylase CobD n=1 Tax=Bradyrhizobium sp. LHD-71 TaxID=3072141 RepID=UPI0028104955|nr:threonine-phosphate decarboxylase CobD [Bradyrhizobium sp. LHD-71]MDQ8729714.1 threonine-phosphate decarboxylase CobD [Bradyrhizobium sp. LHD-71]